MCLFSRLPGSQSIRKIGVCYCRTGMYATVVLSSRVRSASIFGKMHSQILRRHESSVRPLCGSSSMAECTELLLPNNRFLIPTAAERLLPGRFSAPSMFPFPISLFSYPLFPSSLVSLFFAPLVNSPLDIAPYYFHQELITPPDRVSRFIQESLRRIQKILFFFF